VATTRSIANTVSFAKGTPHRRCEELSLVGDTDELPIGVWRFVAAYRIGAFELTGSKWKANYGMNLPDAS
jgi:hypothetical protein